MGGDTALFNLDFELFCNLPCFCQNLIAAPWDVLFDGFGLETRKLEEIVFFKKKIKKNKENDKRMDISHFLLNKLWMQVRCSGENKCLLHIPCFVTIYIFQK